MYILVSQRNTREINNITLDPIFFVLLSKGCRCCSTVATSFCLPSDLKNITFTIVTMPEADYSTAIQQELTTLQNSIYFGELKIFSYFEGRISLLKIKIS